jgi:hypothetical protein
MTMKWYLLGVPKWEIFSTSDDSARPDAFQDSGTRKGLKTVLKVKTQQDSRDAGL